MLYFDNIIAITGRFCVYLTQDPILIVGAGPVGLTLAWRLTQLGLNAQVFEAEDSITDQLRASTFHPPTLDYFDESGITAELIAAGRITPTWQIRMHTSGERAEFDLSVLNEDTAHPYRLQCRQELLGRALAARSKRYHPFQLFYYSGIAR